MATLIHLRARRPFTLDGERFPVGADLFTTPLQAAALRYRGDADFATDHAAKPATPKRRRTYRRRDMRPED